MATGSQSPFSAVFCENYVVLWSSADTNQVPQLYNSTLSTSVSYSRILVVSFVFQFFFRIASFFARAKVAKLFFSGWSPDHQALIPILSHFSILHSQVFAFHYFFYFLIDLVICLFFFCDKVIVISIHYFLWHAAFHLFNPSGMRFISLQYIGSFCISFFICWKALLMYSVKVDH